MAMKGYAGDSAKSKELADWLVQASDSCNLNQGIFFVLLQPPTQRWSCQDEKARVRDRAWQPRGMPTVTLTTSSLLSYFSPFAFRRSALCFSVQYSAPNVKSRLFSGAGGGFLMVISDKPVAGGYQIKINNEFSAKPFPSDKVGDEPKPM